MSGIISRVFRWAAFVLLAFVTFHIGLVAVGFSGFFSSNAVAILAIAGIASLLFCRFSKKGACCG